MSNRRKPKSPPQHMLDQFQAAAYENVMSASVAIALTRSKLHWGTDWNHNPSTVACRWAIGLINTARRCPHAKNPDRPMCIAAWDGVLRCYPCFAKANVVEPSGDERNRCDHCGSVDMNGNGVHMMALVVACVHFTAGLCDACYATRNQVVGYGTEIAVLGTDRGWFICNEDDLDQFLDRQRKDK
jgi:hypothetical protein